MKFHVRFFEGFFENQPNFVLECEKGFIIFDKPHNLLNGTYFPDGFKSSSPQLFPDNYSCDFKVNILI